jgi:ABC-type transporter Mla MlaB component
MWKIQRLEDGDFVILGLSGRLERDQLAELQAAFASEAGNRGVVLDLKEVKLVDQDAVTFLAGCEAGGIKLLHCPSYIRAWITQCKE